MSTTRHTNLQFRQVGKGFIVNDDDNIVGRRLAKTFVDQHERTYVQINGEIIPLTEQHNYLPAD
ncbi:MAG: hypothetical protein ACWGOX_03130 [Desulforhopalus sp.]